jgi:hypothetical protein
MGTRVLLSGLDSLYRNQEWNNKNFKIASAHVMGAAVDNEEIAKSPSYIISDPSALLDVDEWYDPYGIKLGYGTVIEAEVVKFYNLFNREDNSLEAPILYKFYEQDDALGLQGSSSAILPISNYEEIDVEDQIPLIEDADGDGKCDLPMSTPFGPICTIEDIGDNHFGYIGFRDKDGAWVDDGAMNVVIDNWNSLQ